MISVGNVNEKINKIKNWQIAKTWQNMDLRGVNYWSFLGQFEGDSNKIEKTLFTELFWSKFKT